MKKQVLIAIYIVIAGLAFASCRTVIGAGGVDNGVGVDVSGRSANEYDLVPTGDRITYTIDISTPEGRQKLYKLRLADAQRLAETEATRKYNCDRIIDPRFDYLKKGKRILRITIDGRPGNYKARNTEYDSNTRKQIDINIQNR